MASLAPLGDADLAFDVVVVDDGSRPPIVIDQTEYAFPITCLRQEQNSGIVAALNRGLEYILSREYEYVARLDAWDSCAPTRFSKQISFLDANPEHGIVGCDVDFVDWEGKALYRYGPKRSHSDILDEMKYRPSFVHPAVMMRSVIIERVGYYIDDFPGSEDYELFVRILQCSKGHNLDENLLDVYLNPLGISISRRRQMIRSRLHLQMTHFDCTSIHSYFGVLRTLGLFAMPYQLLYAMKRLLRPSAEPFFPGPDRQGRG